MNMGWLELKGLNEGLSRHEQSWGPWDHDILNKKKFAI